MTTFLFIRHGDTDAVGRVLVGRAPGVNLNEKGRRQAEALAERLKGIRIDALLTSPLERTVETARPIAEQHGLEPRESEALNEVSFGSWTGAPFDQLKGNELWQRYNTARSVTRIPGGELISEVQNRVAVLVQELVERFPDRTVALVSHADVIRNAVTYYAGTPIDFLLRFRISPASVTAVSIHGFGAEVLCINNTGDLSFE